MSSTTSAAAATSAEESGSSAQRERRQRILDAAMSLASDGGFDAVQMRAVAEQADVALGTLYRYFPSKIHLLVSALARQFDGAQERLVRREIPGEDPAARVIYVLRRITRGLHGNQQLAEALTRAFMFADKSAQAEISHVSQTLSAILTHAMHPDRSAAEITEEDVDVARVIGDVWLSSLVAWIGGRSTPSETAAHMDRAVRLVLR